MAVSLRWIAGLALALVLATVPKLEARAETVEAVPGGASGEALAKPWSGWWWPASPGTGATLYAVDGPLDKYDRYVATLTGENPETRQWERDNIYFPGVRWAGHCNGWAAAMLLEPEPAAPREIGGVTFDVGDLKGLISGYHFADGAVWTYGSVEDGVNPADFHQALLDWLGGQRKGFVVTFDLGEQGIWNYPAFRFETNWVPVAETAGQWSVTTTLWMADPEVSPDFVGLKVFGGEEGRTIQYLLEGDPRRPSGGSWRGVSREHTLFRPASVWYPEPRVRNIGRELTSPRLERSHLDVILGKPERRAAIRQIYIDMLGRDPQPGDEAGLVSWVDSAHALEDLPAVVAAAGAAERARAIRQLYVQYLGRDPGGNDDAGLMAWVRSPWTLGQIAEALPVAGVAERAAAVRQIYIDFLGRDPAGTDQAGVNGWVRTSLPLAGIQARVIVAGEGERIAAVRRFYVEMLGRDPAGADDASLNGWARSPLRLAEIRQAIRESAEYRLKHPA